MRHAVFVVVMVMVIGAGGRTAALAEEMTWQEVGRGITRASCVVAADAAGVFYVGAANGVYKRESVSQEWRQIFSVRGDNRAVHHLSFGFKDSSALYAATGNGLYRSRDQGQTWQRIFKGKNYLENDCRASLVLPQVYLAGTAGGLLVSRDQGRHWQRAAGKVGSSPVQLLVCDAQEPACIYALTCNALFQSRDAGQTWERVKVAFASSQEMPEEPQDQREEEPAALAMRHLAVDPAQRNCLYLATASGIYRSDDKGRTWVAFDDFGLLSRDVRYILMSDTRGVFAATKSSIFRYRDKRWQEISFGLDTGEINALALDRQHNLYAACEKGLFMGTVVSSAETKTQGSLGIYGKGEPDIRTVQEVAMRYAEVEPEKIIRWRKLAAMKAVLPEVSAGLNRDTSDVWHWEGGSTTKARDDMLVKGRDVLGWDVRVSWDLSELVWNDAQTSIDVRSRLMVELRDEILDEVTRLYFERLRVKMELDNLGIEERKKRFEKELRLQELTASLDALTGGWFSRR